MNRLGARDHRVQRLRWLLRRSSVRETEHAFVAEGVRIVEAAMDAGAPVESLFVAADWRSSAPVAAIVGRASRTGLAVFELGPGIMERVADTVSPQSVCAVVEAVDLGLDELLSRSGPSAERDVVLVCVDVRDPGNLGAVLRIAGATSVSGVICCSGTVDPFNPKVVRASAGALFRVPLVTDVMPAEALGSLAALGYRCWATVPQGGTDYAVAIRVLERVHDLLVRRPVRARLVAVEALRAFEDGPPALLAVDCALDPGHFGAPFIINSSAICGAAKFLVGDAKLCAG